jgi:isopentenyl-diphosphate delta-isomerase
LTAPELRSLVDMIGANAFAIHLNFLEEAIQPEGDHRTRGVAAAIAWAVDTLDVPIIVKETGAGMTRVTAAKLAASGVAALDVGGAGGTSFAIIERLRAEKQGHPDRIALGRALGDWGIPTAAAVASCVPVGIPIVATGGVRSGLDAAKALALGARAVGVARPLLLAAQAGEEALDTWIRQFHLELRTTLMLAGAAKPADMATKPLVAHGAIHDWLATVAPREQPHRRGLS